MLPSQMPKILVIRHGETQWNRQGRLQGRLDTPLTTDGFRQALAVGEYHRERVAAAGEICLWVSPLGRARQTASIVADTWRLPYDSFQVDAALSERSYGHWEGLSQSDIRATRGADFEENGRDPWSFAMDGGESRKQLAARLQTWVDGLAPGPLHIAVTHSGCLRALRGLYTNASLETMLSYDEPQTTSVLLYNGVEEVMDVPESLLSRLGCSDSGKTVWI